MRHVLCLVIAGCILHAVAGQAQAPPPNAVIVTRNDNLAGALRRIAVSTHTRIGFEATDFVRISASFKKTPPLSVSTLEDGLNAVVGADDRYEWREVDDVVVVRPKGAWNDSSNPFNRPLRNVGVENAMPSWVLLAVRDFIYTDKFAVVPRPTSSPIPPVSLHMQSGTVIDVLNDLMVAADQVLWIASYRPIGRPADRFPGWDLDLQIRDANHLNSTSSSHPPAPK
jgi:hypothetical protein